MRIAITDACIFIDLLELDLISAFFKLDIELHTTVEVLNELLSDQEQTLKGYETEKKLKVHKLGKEDFLNMEKIPFPRGLSQQDRSVIYLALNFGDAIVLSSDKLVRRFAENQSLEYHGILWIFDQLVGQRLLQKGDAVVAIKKLLMINTMYSGNIVRQEVEKRINLWDLK